MDEKLRAEGVSLRIWRRGDEDALCAIVDSSRDAFADWLPNALKDLSDLPAFLDHAASSYRNGTGFFYAIEEGEEPVGQCSLHIQGDGTAEIGYWVRTDREGLGLATQAVRTVTSAAFSDGITELFIHCDEGNSRSAAVARHAGYGHAKTVELDSAEPRTRAQTGREMTWVLRMTRGLGIPTGSVAPERASNRAERRARERRRRSGG